MDHEYFKDRVSAYHDMGLPAMEQELMQKHLKECPECRALLAQLEKLDKFVAENSVLSDSDYWERSARKIEDRIEVEADALNRKEEKRSGFGTGWKWLAAAASVTIVSIVSFQYLQENPAPPTLAPQTVPDEPVRQKKTERARNLTEPSNESKSDAGVTKDANEKNASEHDASPNRADNHPTKASAEPETTEEVKENSSEVAGGSTPPVSTSSQSPQRMSAPAQSLADQAEAVKKESVTFNPIKSWLEHEESLNQIFRRDSTNAAATGKLSLADSVRALKDKLALGFEKSRKPQTSGEVSSFLDTSKGSDSNAVQDSTLQLLTACYMLAIDSTVAVEDRGKYVQIITFYSQDKRSVVRDSAAILLSKISK